MLISIWLMVFISGWVVFFVQISNRKQVHDRQEGITISGNAADVIVRHNVVKGTLGGINMVV